MVTTILPITEYIPRILQELSEGNVVLQAEPGAGKSTVLPLSLLGAEWLAGKKVVMLEPRRVAAKTIAHYLASQLGEKVGQRIGYQIKNERKISKETQLEIVTEGILTQRLQNDPEIDDIGLVIFDEFHERSIHADLSLLLTLEIQQTIRDDLKILVMSATIDTSLVANYMGGAEIIECPGRAFPVSVSHTSSSKNPIAIDVVAAIKSVFNSTASKGTAGDVLVFLPGQVDINRCIAAAKSELATGSEVLLLPLYGALSLAQQEQALVPDPNGRRRIVFTTNIAETSLTIEGVTCVIDSGLEKVLVYDPVSGMTRLETEYISKASAEQRKGRAGRTQAGECIRLWDEHKHRTLKDFQGEEILSADLTGLLLQLSQWGSSDYDEINWLTPPPKPHYDSAKNILKSLGMITADDKLTALGDRSTGLGLSPRLAAMLLKAEGLEEQGIACELAALLSDRDVFHHHKGVDIIDRLLAVQEYKVDRKSALNAYPLKRSGVEQLLDSAVNYKRALNVSSKPRQTDSIFSLSELQNTVGKLLLYAYPDRLAQQRANADGRYQLANGRGVFLYEDDPLYGSDWLVVADGDGQKKEGRIYSAASISADMVLDCLEDQIDTSRVFEFDPIKQKIIGREVTRYGAITLKSTAISDSDIPPEVFIDCLPQVFKTCGLDVLNWTSRCEALVARAQWLGDYVDDFPKLSSARLLDSLDAWLFPYLSGVKTIAGLKKINVFDLLLSTLSWDEQQLLDKEAPTQYITPSHKTLPIIYDPQQGPTVSVQLQEMFGQVDSPMIGGGKVAIRFELLSPARRPIQTTSDLGHFWQTSYFEVAKEMRGKYPKHRWSEEPLLEKPGRSIKSRW